MLLDGLPDVGADPEARYEAKEAIALAFVTAVSICRRASGPYWCSGTCSGSAPSEVADMLDSSEASVNSALQRARATMDTAARSGPGARAAASFGPRAGHRVTVRHRLRGNDIDGVVALLTDDAWFTMPPVTLEYQGHEAIAGFLRDITTWRGPRQYRLIPSRANGQPAFGCYLQDAQAPVFRAHGIIVLTLEGDRISAITRFVDNSNMARFGTAEDARLSQRRETQNLPEAMARASPAIRGAHSRPRKDRSPRKQTPSGIRRTSSPGYGACPGR